MSRANRVDSCPFPKNNRGNDLTLSGISVDLTLNWLFCRIVIAVFMLMVGTYAYSLLCKASWFWGDAIRKNLSLGAALDGRWGAVVFGIIQLLLTDVPIFFALYFAIGFGTKIAICFFRLGLPGLVLENFELRFLGLALVLFDVVVIIGIRPEVMFVLGLAVITVIIVVWCQKVLSLRNAYLKQQLERYCDDKAFAGRSTLDQIVIPEGVPNIGKQAFENCSSLTSVAIPNSVTSIGEHAFSYCSSLTSVTMPDSVTRIGNHAFEGCCRLTSITIPNSVTSIGFAAFYGCCRLTSVTIPNSVTSIESNAFEGCSKLTSVAIPNSVTSIGKQAFKDCSGLTSITIPNSVTSIETEAFKDCSSLERF